VNEGKKIHIDFKIVPSISRHPVYVYFSSGTAGSAGIGAVWI